MFCDEIDTFYDGNTVPFSKRLKMYDEMDSEETTTLYDESTVLFDETNTLYDESNMLCE